MKMMETGLVRTMLVGGDDFAEKVVKVTKKSSAGGNGGNTCLPGNPETKISRNWGNSTSRG